MCFIHPACTDTHTGHADLLPPPFSLQDFADLTASCASFVPTVTAISTCPDLQWMVQPLISSVAPSQRAHPYSSAPAYPRQASKALKRSRADQVLPPAGGAEAEFQEWNVWSDCCCCCCSGIS